MSKESKGRKPGALSRCLRFAGRRKPLVFEVDPKSWTVENEIGTGRKHSEEKLFRVLFCLGK